MLYRYARLGRTLRHLKGKQLFYQLYYRVRTKVGGQHPANVDALLVDSEAWPEGLSLSSPCNADAFKADNYSFRFVNLEHSFSGEIDWYGGPHGKLWDYNLHYFEWLWGLEPEAAKQVVLDWVERHPYAVGAVGWEPYPLSLRITNWIGYWASKGRALLDEDESFRETLFRSLGQQCDWLTMRLEKHILGNHYLENGVALWIAGTFFKGTAAGEWLKIGDAILEEQLDEQILKDGMHFELSPMYHNRVVWLLSWLTTLDNQRFGKWHERAKSAALLLKHPDGQVALFNDSAFGIYPETEGESPTGTFALESAGYYGMRTVSEDYIICDASRIGPDYIPGHAHCDIGSFEFSIGGERFITDTGVYHYIESERRHHSRETSAHNVLAPKEVEQAEIWSAFRVGDRPDVNVEQWQPDDNGFKLKVAHNGFLKAGVSISRSFTFDSSSCKLSIADAFNANEETSMLGRLHLSPTVTVSSCEGQSVTLDHQGQRVIIHFEGVDNVAVAQSEYYPEFNLSIKRPCLEYEIIKSSGEVAVRIEWSR